MKIMAGTFAKTLDRIYPLIPEENLPVYSQLFRNELLKALSNQRSSLPTILNPIHRMVPEASFGVAVSVGGTNGYTSAFRVSKKGVIKFINRRMFFLPTQTTGEELFRLISENVFKVSGQRKQVFPIGIGFAYPLKPLLHHGFIDGELMYTTKGRNITGLIGKKIGQEYHKYLIKEYGFDTRVSVANDAICLLMGGDRADLAGVVGTGLNFAYWEKRINIAPMKLSELTGFGQAEVAVNIESANFALVEKTVLGKKVDKKSSNKGRSLSEKETAGAYLYQLFNEGKNDLLGEDFPALTSTDQLHQILTGSFSGKGLDGKMKHAKDFAERIFRRSAQMTALQLAGVLMKIGRTKGIVPVVMEGGIFWKAYNYSTYVNYYLHEILPEVIPSFARLFGSSRRGIAILATGL